MVLLISIDGLRPDGLIAAQTPTIDSLIENGASTVTAQTVMPCCTLPCHTSMLRGVDATRHGIVTNTFHPIVRPVPSIFDVATFAGLKCGFFYNWGPLRDLCDPESTVVSTYLRDSHRPEGDVRVTRAAIDFLASSPLDFLFVYLGYTDECGHANGWMSPQYLDAVANADRCISEILAAAPVAKVLVTSDHGGHDRTHGTSIPEDMTVPFILSGPGIRSAYRIETDVIIYDVAPTLAHLLGLEIPREWDGRVIREALLDC